MTTKDQTALGIESDAKQGGSDRPPSSPPVRLDSPVMPTATLARSRQGTLRMQAVVDRISAGEPVDANLINRMNSDITELRKANAELATVVRRQNQKLAALTAVFRSMSDGAIACDLSGRITMFNKGAEAIFQLEKDEDSFDPKTSNALETNIFHLCEQSLYKGETGSVPDAGLMDRLKANGTVQNLRIVFKGNRGKITHTLFTLDYIRDEDEKAIGLIAIIKDNNEVEGLAQVDALTGLVNRRVLEQKIREVHGSLKRGHYERDCATVLFLDVDHFKDFNTKYGHDAGDRVLRAVAETLRHCGRDIDTVARYGGEEFVIVLPSVDEAGAKIVAERVRKAIAETQVSIANGLVLSVTASIGTTTHRKGSGVNQIVLTDQDKNTLMEDFLRKANEAMSAAKRTGRNRVCAA